MTFSRRTLTFFAALSALVSGCRASVEAPSEGQSLTLKEVADERPTQPVFERVVAGVALGERAGFDFKGAATCLPLPEGRSCYSGPGPSETIRKRCEAAPGESFVCEDCSVLCSVDLFQ